MSRASAAFAWRVARATGRHLLLQGPTATLRRVRRELRGTRRQYRTWAERFDTPDRDQVEALRREAAVWSNPPLLSVLMPVYDPPESALRAALDSLLGQAYPHWELCAADDCSPSPHVLDVLREYAAADGRIRFVAREVNGHISAASNSALELARGSHLVLVDHDDVLPPHALHVVARAVRDQPDANLIYSDEDKLDARGRRYGPYFKPAWDSRLLLGQNCISHLGAYRTRLVRELGGFRSEYDGSQDYDLALRVGRAVPPETVVHVPQVLYHWRQAGSATTYSSTHASAATQAARRAVADALLAAGEQAVVAPASAAPLWTEVRFCVPEPRPAVSIHRLVGRAGASNEPWRPAAYGVPITVEDVTVADSVAATSAAVDASVADALSDFVLLAADGWAPAGGDWLEALVGEAVRDGVAVAGGKLLSRDGLVLSAGCETTARGEALDLHRGFSRWEVGYSGWLALARTVPALRLPGLLVRREVWEAVGGLTGSVAGAVPGTSPEIALCLQANVLGWRCIYVPRVEVRRTGWRRAAWNLEGGRSSGRPDPTTATHPGLMISHGEFAEAPHAPAVGPAVRGRAGRPGPVTQPSTNRPC